MKRQRIEPGAVVAVDLGDGRRTYGRLLVRPYVEIFDRIDADEADLAGIAASPVLFTVAVSDHAVTSGRWPIVGRLSFDEDTVEMPLNFKQDDVDPRQCWLVDAWGNEDPATIEECEGLEPLAVWEPTHVEDRIRDHYAGRPNIWLESLKLKR